MSLDYDENQLVTVGEDCQLAKNDMELSPEYIRIEQLCQMLEKTKTFDLDQFFWDDIDNENAHCGTPSCILGHAWTLWPELRGTSRGIAVMLGVDYQKFDDLCHVWDSPECGGLRSEQITGDMAAAAIRRLRDTGEAYFSLDDA